MVEGSDAKSLAILMMYLIRIVVKEYGMATQYLAWETGSYVGPRVLSCVPRMDWNPVGEESVRRGPVMLLRWKEIR